MEEASVQMETTRTTRTSRTSRASSNSFWFRFFGLAAGKQGWYAGLVRGGHPKEVLVDQERLETCLSLLTPKAGAVSMYISPKQGKREVNGVMRSHELSHGMIHMKYSNYQ